ncbi:flagellar motor protein MotB [Paenibacillus beijingensis]|uniref:Flagellar motor protein MotB n=1 Tax=Paenibacillus beijingensis TaxID=1126833 RepID=A0A0D5NJ08_9BACL|nr:flagellar motor protein MotB [Paenibacillus beijingensis]AJY74977.1 flagellar motor protein MotB [Paenibacillus beijingensis]
MAKKHRHEAHEEHTDESWLIPYADLLTLLLALFIVLYAASTTDVKKFQEMSQAFNIALTGGNGVLESYKSLDSQTPNSANRDNKTDSSEAQSDARSQDLTLQQLIQKEQENLEKLKKQLDQYIKKNGLTSQLQTKLNQSQLLITISDNALFSSGSAVVKPNSRSLAVSIANMLQQYPGYEIIVSGHTDNEPISTPEFKSNWDLSSTRAIRFMDIMLANKKLDPKLFSAVGYGEYRPVASNESAIGRSQNRRVEVSIIRKYTDPSRKQNVSAGISRP